MKHPHEPRSAGPGCGRTRERLELYLDRELGPAEAEAVAAHLAACPECRAELEALQALDRLVRETEPPRLADEYWDWHRRETWRRIRSRDKARPSAGRIRRFRPTALAAGIAAVLLLAAGGWFLLSDSPWSMRPARVAEEIALVAPDTEEPAPRPPDRTPKPAPEVSAAAPTPEPEPETRALARPSEPGPALDTPDPEIGIAARAETDDRLPAPGLLPAAPETLAPEQALARYRAFEDSVREKAARIRDDAEPPRLAALAPLPPAPGTDSITVAVRAFIRPDGSLERLELIRGSGHPETDSLIRLAFTRARYLPAYRHGLPVSGRLEINRRLAPVLPQDQDH